METLNQLLQLFPYAVMGSILAGIICAFLGIFVNSQRSVFLGAVLTQVSIAGVAFSFLHFINLEALFYRLFGVTISETGLLHNLEPVLFSLLFAVITVLLFSQ
ncbi:MAG: metal ABC transporter permease, partial [Methanococcaceae archaeon]